MEFMEKLQKQKDDAKAAPAKNHSEDNDSPPAIAAPHAIIVSSVSCHCCNISKTRRCVSIKHFVYLHLIYLQMG